MGNKRARDLSRPKGRGKACSCDIFELTVTGAGHQLMVCLRTDLPSGTRVTVNAHRLFCDSDGREWHWTCLEEVGIVAADSQDLRGFELRRTNDELDTKGLHMYRYLKRSMSLEISGMPSTSLQLSVTAPTTPHQFGICNRQLTGTAVTVRPGGHSLERSAEIDLPVSEMVMNRLGL
ncbi:MAG: hypothetical protein KDA96_23120 [Planctomycetaceae bacterium]|nr:hypothetical protein [Planctomycetaceae bacterium]MCA9065987.1 hypothetical protein [Planctomycetaceae bacterium]